MATKNINLIGTSKVYEDKPRERINKKTGKREYQVRYTYYDATGKRRDSNGKWKPSARLAIEDAKESLSKHIIIIEKGKTKKVEYSVREVAKQYYESLKNEKPRENMSPASKESKSGDVKTLFLRDDAYTPKYILNRKINKLDEEDIASWLNHLKKVKLNTKGREMSSTTYNKYKTCIKALINFAFTQEYFEGNYKQASYLIHTVESKMFYMKKRNTIDKSARVMTEEQFRRFISYKRFSKGVYEGEHQLDYSQFDREFLNYIMFSMFYYAGLRTAELRVLKWKNIDFESDGNGALTAKIHITTSWGDRTSKEDKANAEEILKTKKAKNENAVRIIPVKGMFAEDLDFYQCYFMDFYRTYDLDDYLLFPAKNGGFINDNTINSALEYRLRSIKDEVPVFSKHDFRASCAYRMLKQGMTYEELLDFFGHEDSKMLKTVYNRLKPEDNYQLMNKIFTDKQFGAKEQEDHINKLFTTDEDDD